MPLQQFDERIPVLSTGACAFGYLADTWVLLNTGGNNVVRWDTMMAFNNDTIDHTLQFAWNQDETTQLGTVLVPAGAGFTAVPPLDVLNALMPSAFHYLVYDFNVAALYMRCHETMANGKIVAAALLGGAF